MSVVKQGKKETACEQKGQAVVVKLFRARCYTERPARAMQVPFHWPVRRYRTTNVKVEIAASA